jgi:hypothetical protein
MNRPDADAFIDGSLPHASVEGARRPPHVFLHAPFPMAAGFVLRTVKRRQACYKLEGVHTSLRDPYATGLHVLGCNTERQHFVRGRFSPCLPVSARAVVKSTVDGRFPAGELICRAPGLFATSAFLGGGEAHSHIEPPEVRPINLYSLPKRTEWTAEHTKEEHVNENGVQTKAAEVLGLRTRVQRVGDLQRALRRERIGAGEDRLRPRPGRLPQLRITQCCSAGRAPYKLALVSIVSNARAREGYGRGRTPIRDGGGRPYGTGAETGRHLHLQIHDF